MLPLGHHHTQRGGYRHDLSEHAGASGASGSNTQHLVDPHSDDEAATQRGAADNLRNALLSKNGDSARCRYAEQTLDRNTRALLTDVLISDLRDAQDTGRALDALEAVWGAQLKIHTSHEKKQLRDSKLDTVIFQGMATVMTGGLILPILIADLRKHNRDYNRSAERPEYHEALNNMMDVMRMIHLGPASRRRVAGLLLDRNMRDERTLVPEDHNALVRAIEPDGPRMPKRGHLAIKPPNRGTPDVESTRQDRIIALAESGYRAFWPTAQATVPRPTQQIVKIDDYESVYKRLPELNLGKLLEQHYPDEVPKLDELSCQISFEQLTNVKYPVALFSRARNDNGHPLKPGYYDFEQLVTWINERGKHPLADDLLGARNVRELVFRLDMTKSSSEPLAKLSTVASRSIVVGT